MVQIITDTSSLYTPSEAESAGFASVPLCISIGDCHERDLLIDMKSYYEKIHQGLVPTSSQPPLGDVMEAFEAYEDSDIINISMADGLSGTYQTACSARNMMKHRDRIFVFNSRTLCGPHRYMVQKAQELKPIMKLTADGRRLDKFGLKRTMASAADSIIQYLKKKQLGKNHILYISHANALQDAEKIRALFEQAFEQLEIQVLELSAVFVAQGGPKCVAIQYIRR